MCQFQYLHKMPFIFVQRNVWFLWCESIDDDEEMMRVRVFAWRQSMATVKRSFNWIFAVFNIVNLLTCCLLNAKQSFCGYTIHYTLLYWFWFRKLRVAAVVVVVVNFDLCFIFCLTVKKKKLFKQNTIKFRPNVMGIMQIYIYAY